MDSKNFSNKGDFKMAMIYFMLFLLLSFISAGLGVLTMIIEISFSGKDYGKLIALFMMGSAFFMCAAVSIAIIFEILNKFELCN